MEPLGSAIHQSVENAAAWLEEVRAHMKPESQHSDEGLLRFAWKVLPVSGVLELSAVLLFAANLAITFLLGHSAFATNTSRQRVEVQ